MKGKKDSPTPKKFFVKATSARLLNNLSQNRSGYKKVKKRTGYTVPSCER